MINGEIKNLPLSFGHQIEFYKKLMTGLNVTSWFLKFLSYDIDPDWKRKSIQILPFFIFSQNSRHQEETEGERDNSEVSPLELIFTAPSQGLW